MFNALANVVRQWHALKIAGEANVSQGGSWLQELTNKDVAPTKTTEELFKAYGTTPWLRAVNWRISNDIASIPWTLWLTRRPKEEMAYRHHILQRADFETRQRLMAKLHEDGELVKIFNHPLLTLLNAPNFVLDGFQAKQATQLHLDISGEGYQLILRNALGLPGELWPIPPNWVEEIPSTRNGMFKLQLPGGVLKASRDDVIWFRDIDPANPYGRGSGTGKALSDELAIHEYASKHMGTWFYNGARPDALITAEDAGDDEVLAAKTRYDNEHRGVWKAFRSYWSNFKLDVHRMDTSFSDMEMVKLRDSLRDDIIQVYGVPPEMLGIVENSNRATIDAADFLYATHTLLPRQERWRSRYQVDLVPLYDERLLLHYESPVPADREFQLKAAQAAPQDTSRDEWRNLSGKPADENSPDVYHIPFNLVTQEVETGDVQDLAPVPEAASHGTPTRSTGPLDRALRSGDINQVVNSIDPIRLTIELDPRFKDLVDKWGTEVLDEVDIGVSFNLVDERITTYLRDQSATRIKGLTNNTTRDAIRKALSEGVGAGEGTEKLAKRIRGVFTQANAVRARRIARTESVRSANFATTEAYKQSGVVKRREWVPTLDSATRDSHAAMQGETATVDGEFILNSGPNQGSTAPYPGNFGIPEEDINCRCTTVAVIEAPKTVEQLTVEWKVFDRKLIPWERQIERATRKGFNNQLADVLATLDRLAVED